MMRGAVTSTVLWTLLVIGGLALACGGREDTKSNVSRALAAADLSNVSVEVDEDPVIVHLKGAVGTMAERTHAEAVASNAVGTTGRVLNELTVDGLAGGAARSPDDDIQDALSMALDKDPVLKERDISVDVADGVVTIKGDVRTIQEKNRATVIAKAATGVKDLTNALAIKPRG